MKRIVFLIMSLLIKMTGVAQQQDSDLTLTEALQQQTQLQEDAIKVLQKIKVSGYFQSQFQYGEENASLKVGTSNENPEKSYNRIGIRRGRIKFTFEEGIATGVFQLDITEKGVALKDAYLNIKDKWIGTNSFRAGVFDRPFGYEISYSSSKRESPERSTVFQTLFPDERDLGGMLTLQTSKNSPWNFLKLEAGLFAGNGVRMETDNRRDFIGHLSANKNIGADAKFGLGVSYYNGGVFQGTNNIYTMKDKGFVLDSTGSNKGEFAKREYIGFDGQFSIISVLGMTQVRSEYLFGIQPGVKSNSKSPNASTLPTTDTYIRNFNGGYVLLIQDFGTLPVSAVLKYDWYNPNTKVSGNEIGLKGTGSGDISYNTFGLGLLWRASPAVRLQAYYEIVKNETSENLTGYHQDRKDNVFTLRLQYKF